MSETATIKTKTTHEHLVALYGHIKDLSEITNEADNIIRDRLNDAIETINKILEAAGPTAEALELLNDGLNDLRQKVDKLTCNSG